MTITQLKSIPNIPDDQLDDWGFVPEPIDSDSSAVSGIILQENPDGSKVGIWNCTPGKWRRQVQEAEMCYFMRGRCNYTDEDGNVTEISEGDMVYLPAKSLGIWEIFETSRKAFITYQST